MLLKSAVILMVLAIFASLAAALVFLFRDRSRRNSRNMVRALTWRIGLSVTLFLLLIAGFYFGIVSPTGLSGR
jgi:predicted membrane metal-binding protein